MDTIIERDVQHDSGNASALTGIVAIIAILLVVGLAFYTLQIYPFNRVSPADSTATPSINVHLNGALPGANSSAQ